MLVMLVFEFDDGFTVQFFKRDHKQKLGFNFSFFLRIFNRAQKFSRVLRTRDIFYYYIKRHDATNNAEFGCPTNNKWSIMMIQNKYKNITVSVDQEG